MQLILPYPPSANHYLGRNGHHSFIKPDGKAYRETVGWLCVGKKKLQGRVAVHIVVYPPDKRRRDLANTEKFTIDSIVHAGVMDDDEQIDDLHIVRGPVRPGGQLKVTLTELPSAA